MLPVNATDDVCLSAFMRVYELMLFIDAILASSCIESNRIRTCLATRTTRSWLGQSRMQSTQWWRATVRFKHGSLRDQHDDEGISSLHGDTCRTQIGRGNGKASREPVTTTPINTSTAPIGAEALLITAEDHVRCWAMIRRVYSSHTRSLPSANPTPICQPSRSIVRSLG